MELVVELNRAVIVIAGVGVFQFGLDLLQLSQLLVECGADVRATNRYGVSPLSIACMNGSAEIVEMLLEAGADPQTTLPGGETALMTAARTGRIDPLQALLARGADVNGCDMSRW